MSGGVSQIQMPAPLVRRLRPIPQFPIVYLKGPPIFWDDFDSGLAGFIPQDGDSPQFPSTAPQGIVGYGTGYRHWTYGDGNEYSCYVTSEAGVRNGRSLRLGGSPATYAANSNDIRQDVSCGVSVKSGILGIEFSCLFGNIAAGQSLQLSVENSTFLDSTHDNFNQCWMYITPRTAGGNCVASVGTASKLLLSNNAGSNPTADSNGNFWPNTLTRPTSVVCKGGGSAWHRWGATIDMNTLTYLDFYFDGYYVNCRNVAPQSPSIGSYIHSNAPSYAELGLVRIEMHNNDLTPGSAFYMDDFVVTDEAGFV